jgi:hypothetical protein
MKLRSFIIILFSILSAYSCKKKDNIELADDFGKLHIQQEFTAVNYGMITSDRRYVFVGEAVSGPAILVLNEDFTKDYFKTFPEYSGGSFNKAIELRNGDLAMAGYTVDIDSGATSNDPNFLCLSLDRLGSVVWSDVNDWRVHNQWNDLVEDEDGYIILAGEFAYDNGRNRRFVSELLIFDNEVNQATKGTLYSLGSGVQSLLSEVEILPNGDYVFLDVGFNSTHSEINPYLTFVDFDSFKPNINTVEYHVPKEYPLGPTPLAMNLFSSNISTDMVLNNGNIMVSIPVFDATDGNYGSKILNVSYSGNINWSKKFNGKFHFTAEKIFPCSLGYLIIGYSQERDKVDATSDAYIIAIDGNGNALWEYAYGSNNRFQNAKVAVENNGLFHISGVSMEKNRHNPTIFQFTLDSKGNLIN